jgi:hypothetical protein
MKFKSHVYPYRQPQGRQLVILLLLLIMPFVASAVSAQEELARGVTIAAEAGYDGYYKAQYGLPVQVTVANSGPAIEGEVRVVIGAGVRGTDLVYSAPIALPTQSQKRLSLFVYVAGYSGRLSVELVDVRGSLIQRVETNSLTPLQSDELLYGVVGGQAGRLGFLDHVDGGRGRAAVAFLNLEDLPEAPSAWNALDILIVADADTGQLSPVQLEALNGWLATGGQLVVTGGSSWQKNSSGLAAWLPVVVNGSRSLADLPALEQQIGIPFRDPGPYLVATSQLRSGDVMLHQDGLPLLARHSWGRGAVYFLALDPSLAPLRDWDGSPLLWSEIAAAAPRLPFWAMGPQNSYAAGTAVESLPGLALPSVLSLFAFLMVYVIVIGPANYFILRRLNRREVAWLTIPAIIFIFSAAAYLTGFQLKGNDVVLNQMSIVYGRAGSEAARVHSLLGVYSPRRATYDVFFPANSLVRPFNRSTGLMVGAGSAGGQIVQEREVVAPATRVDVGGVATFIVETVQPPPALHGQAVLRQSGRSQLLEVNVQNDSNATLTNVSIIFGNYIVAVGDMAPGSGTSVSHTLAAAGAAGSSRSRPPGYGSFFSAHYDVLLGTYDYYSDGEAYPRYQLLESLAQGGTGWLPPGVVTLVAWSDQPQIEAAVSQRRYSQLATSLYFIELPVIADLGDGRNVTIPHALINWKLLTEQASFPGAVPFSPYDPYGQANAPNNLYLPPGALDFEYQPWPSMQQMAVNQLAVDLQGPGMVGTPLPIGVYLWHWSEERWQQLTSADWGVTAVPDPTPFLGPANTVRIRLQNETSSTYEIHSIYPSYTGDLQ